MEKVDRSVGTFEGLESLPFNSSVEKIKNSVGEFQSKIISKDEMAFLSLIEPDYPVIPVESKCYLLAVNGKDFTGVTWLAGWFEIISVYRGKDNICHVKMKVIDKIIEVDYDMLYPKDITCLTKYGIVINFDHVDAISRYVFKMITKLSLEEQTYCIGFVRHDEKLIFEAYDKEPQILQYTERITLSEYVEGLNKLLTNMAVMFALCCSCASLFLAYLSMRCGVKLQSFIISFYGKTTTGKSTAQALMASVYTKPDDNQIFIPFFGTLNAIIKNLSNKFGVPQIFDEATVSSNINMENLLYTITLEHDKSRCSSNAVLKESDTWKLIVITSSENRLLPDNRMHNKGLDARLLGFGDLRYTDSREHSDQIHDFCGNNYGVLGKALAGYLLNAEPDKVVELYENCKDNMRKAVGEENAFDITERLINEYALILMSAKILTEFHINMDINGITDILTANHSEIAERSNIAEKYYNHLIAYAAMNPFLAGIKKDESNNTIAFVDELFLKILINHGALNTDLVIKELDSAGYIFRRKHNSIKNRLRFNGTLAGCYELYLPDEKTESEEDCLSLEYILSNFEGIDES